VQKFGKPDVFITFTCNPRWPGITENLGTYTLANDRPDLVARVFYVKLKALMHDITVGRIFGNVNAYVYTVEFQKRGLPHAHILIILGEDSKLLDAQDFGNIVCASLPDPLTDRRLFNCVTSHMIHGPCGQLNPNSPCMVDNSCSKKFPKQYCNETVYVSDGGTPCTAVRTMVEWPLSDERLVTSLSFHTTRIFWPNMTLTSMLRCAPPLKASSTSINMSKRDMTQLFWPYRTEMRC